MEAWTREEKPNLTWSHPWAASPANIIPRRLFGIQPTSLGYATFDAKVQPGTLRQYTATVPTIRGNIIASYANKRFELAVPGLSTATVYLPHRPGHVWAHDRIPAAVSPCGNFFVFHPVRAGRHVFTQEKE